MTIQEAAVLALRAFGTVTGADVARFHGGCTRIQAEKALANLAVYRVAVCDDPPRTRFDSPPRRWRLARRGK